MKIKLECIGSNEKIVYIHPDIEELENSFWVDCCVKDLKTLELITKEAGYTTKREAERKLFLWNKIFDNQNKRSKS